MTDSVNRNFFGQSHNRTVMGRRPNALLLGTLGRYLPAFSDKFGFVLQTCSFATYLWVLGTAVPILNGDMTSRPSHSN
jgi:hypothetical protein